VLCDDGSPDLASFTVAHFSLFSPVHTSISYLQSYDPRTNDHHNRDCHNITIDSLDCSYRKIDFSQKKNTTLRPFGQPEERLKSHQVIFDHLKTILLTLHSHQQQH
jgi:hypothetical protein